jgi:hypothetical protein
MTFESRPSTYKLRNGKVLGELRDKASWHRALQGHIYSAHGGKVEKKCAACRELTEKADGKIFVR